MLKIHIYLLFIAFFIISCSDSSDTKKIDPSEAIKGDWSPSSEKIVESSEIISDKNMYWIPEIKEKNAARVSQNVAYSFRDGGELHIHVLSELDQAGWKKEGTWNLLDSLLVINIKGEEKQNFKLQLLSDKKMILEDKKTSNTLIFYKKEDLAVE